MRSLSSLPLELKLEIIGWSVLTPTDFMNQALISSDFHTLLLGPESGNPESRSIRCRILDQLSHRVSNSVYDVGEFRFPYDGFPVQFFRQFGFSTDGSCPRDSGSDWVPRPRKFEFSDFAEVGQVVRLQRREQRWLRLTRRVESLLWKVDLEHRHGRDKLIVVGILLFEIFLVVSFFVERKWSAFANVLGLVIFGSLWIGFELFGKIVFLKTRRVLEDLDEFDLWERDLQSREEGGTLGQAIGTICLIGLFSWLASEFFESFGDIKRVVAALVCGASAFFVELRLRAREIHEDPAVFLCFSRKTCFILLPSMLLAPSYLFLTGQLVPAFPYASLPLTFGLSFFLVCRMASLCRSPWFFVSSSSPTLHVLLFATLYFSIVVLANDWAVWMVGASSVAFVGVAWIHFVCRLGVCPPTQLFEYCHRWREVCGELARIIAGQDCKRRLYCARLSSGPAADEGRE